MMTDVRYAIRMLRKHPAFVLVAVLTIAIGVGANTALFSVVDAVLLKKLPVKDPDQLVLFNASWNTDKSGLVLVAHPAGEPRFYEECARCKERRDLQPVKIASKAS